MNYNTDRRISPGALTWGAWQAFYVILKYFLQFENYLVEGFLGTLIGNRKYFSEKIRKLRKTRFPLNQSVRSRCALSREDGNCKAGFSAKISASQCS